MVARSMVLILFVVLMIGTPVGAQEDSTPTPTPVPVPTMTPLLVAPSVQLEYYVISGTEQIANDMANLSMPENPAQPLILGFGGVIIGVFVLAFIRSLVGNR